MSDEPFLKCPCQNCGDSIEFPGQGVGLTIECPHCGQRTLLTGPPGEETVTLPVAPAAAPAPRPEPLPLAQTEPARSRSRVPVATILVLVALAGVAFWYFKAGPGGHRIHAASAESPSLSASTRATNEAPPEAATNTAAAPSSDKSIDDLKPGAVTLERAKSGSLMYAVGTVRNESLHQRFGVKVEIEFTDTKGRPAGKASDYTQVIEPRQAWRFRALVLDARAASGKVVGIKEDN